MSGPLQAGDRVRTRDGLEATVVNWHVYERWQLGERPRRRVEVLIELPGKERRLVFLDQLEREAAG